ncbi:MAG: intermembrane transport protein PqiB [Polyangiaceae bacterium]
MMAARHDGDLPTATVKRHRRVSPVWIVPIVAAGLLVYLAWTSFARRGPLLTLHLATAEGLTVDQTQVKHRAVTLGTVEEIRLAEDMKSVIVTARMVGGNGAIWTDHARFWVVRPRFSSGSVTGLETLVSGAYIEVDPGLPGGVKQHEFTALKEPPGRQSDEPGLVLVLKAKRLGSLGVGTPVYYRDVQVGEVLGCDLGDQPGPVSLRVFVREPYDRFVRSQTRFWNVSGLSVSMGAEGMHVELESLQALISGGIAFETPGAPDGDAPVQDLAAFDLYESKATADATLYEERIPFVTYFRTSVQGLAPGAPVQLFGVQIGNVSNVKLVYDPDKHCTVARVAFDVQPERIVGRGGGSDPAVAEALRQDFGKSGLRVVLESSSLLTGTKDLAIDYEPRKLAGELPREGDARVLPGTGGGIESLTATLNEVATRMEKIPFEAIGQRADATLAQLPAVAQQMAEAAQKASGTFGPEGYGRGSPFERNMDHLMNQVGDAARSFRALTDYLDRHPEALLRGRASEGAER